MLDHKLMAFLGNVLYHAKMLGKPWNIIFFSRAVSEEWIPIHIVHANRSSTIQDKFCLFEYRTSSTHSFSGKLSFYWNFEVFQNMKLCVIGCFAMRICSDPLAWNQFICACSKISRELMCIFLIQVYYCMLWQNLHRHNWLFSIVKV